MTRLEEIRTRVEAGVLDVETLMEVNKDMADLLKFVDLMVESGDICTSLAMVTSVTSEMPGPNQAGFRAMSDLYAAMHEQIHVNLQKSGLE